MHRVADIMAKRLVTISPDEPVGAIAERMTRADVGGVPVVEGDRLVGFVSKTDLVDRVGERGLSSTLCASDLMTTAVVTTGRQALLVDVIRTMVFEGVHHVVVVDEDGGVMGVLGVWDVMLAIADGRIHLEPGSTKEGSTS